jgi:hypothetical protein
LVLTGHGLSCETETAASSPSPARRPTPSTSAICASARRRASTSRLPPRGLRPGSFSFGDRVAAGACTAIVGASGSATIWPRFVDDGGLALGICNGFQTSPRLDFAGRSRRAASRGVGVRLFERRPLGAARVARLPRTTRAASRSSARSGGGQSETSACCSSRGRASRAHLGGELCCAGPSFWSPEHQPAAPLPFTAAAKCQSRRPSRGGRPGPRAGPRCHGDAAQ